MIWLITGIAAATIVAVSWPIKVHNRLISMHTTVVDSWRGIDIELTRRWELVPSLVEVAQAYAKHEADVLARIAAKRASAQLGVNPSDASPDLSDNIIADETRSDAELAGALGQLRAVAEAYPQLRSSGHYSELMAALRNTDDRISAARRLYNGNVSRYNAKLRSFPGSVIGRRAGMTSAAFFEIATPDHAGVPSLRSRQS